MSADKELPAASNKTVDGPNPWTAPTISQRSERPGESYNPYQPYTNREEEAPIGNPKSIMVLKLEGQLGIFYDRCNTTRVPTLIEINFDNIRDASHRVIANVLQQSGQQTKTLDDASVNELIASTANELANGVAVMTYLKLRMVNYYDERVANRFQRKPKVPRPFQIPEPFALPISQLGQIKVSGMPAQLYFSPTVPADAHISFGCHPEHNWCPDVYARAVEFAKKLGMRFSSVDLTVKMGSSWWLYRPVNEAETFRLDCPFPEENFTANTAVIASLFTNTANNGFNNPVIDLAPLGNRNYGSMLRNPPQQLSLNTYYAIT